MKGKLPWAFPTRTGAAPSTPAKPAKPAPKPAKPPASPPAPPKRAPKRIEASRKGGGQGGSLPPAPAKTPKPPTADVLRVPVVDPAERYARHPITGQLLGDAPGRPPRLRQKNGEVTGRKYWRYEGCDTWNLTIAGALHTWMALFRNLFPAEAAMIANQFHSEMADAELLDAPEEEDLLS